jgi:hypothetical protein
MRSGLVCKDREYPARQRRPRLESADIAQHRDPGFLRDLLGRGPVAQDRRGKANHAGIVPPIHTLKGSTIPRDKPWQQFGLIAQHAVRVSVGVDSDPWGMARRASISRAMSCASAAMSSAPDPRCSSSRKAETLA